MQTHCLWAKVSYSWGCTTLCAFKGTAYSGLVSLHYWTGLRNHTGHHSLRAPQPHITVTTNLAKMSNLNCHVYTVRILTKWSDLLTSKYHSLFISCTFSIHSQSNWLWLLSRFMNNQYNAMEAQTILNYHGHILGVQFRKMNLPSWRVVNTTCSRPEKPPHAPLTRDHMTGMRVRVEASREYPGEYPGKIPASFALVHQLSTVVHLASWMYLRGYDRKFCSSS